MPNKGKYGPMRKHCTSCAYATLASNGYAYCRIHLERYFPSHWCESHIDTRSKKGKEILESFKQKII